MDRVKGLALFDFDGTLIKGDSIIDITGGFGVDCLYFSKQFKNVIHCEISDSLSTIVNYNYKQLNKLKAKQHIIPEVQETALQMTKIILTIMGESEDHISQTIEEYRIKEF